MKGKEREMDYIGMNGNLGGNGGWDGPAWLMALVALSPYILAVVEALCE